MSITLYHSVESTCAQKVRFILAEKKLGWTEILLNLRKGEQFDPEYLKLNPKAVVPTLIHDSKVVRESSVIAEYIDDVFPEPPLRPQDPHDRSIMRLLMKAFDEEVHSSVGVLCYAIFLRHQMNELKSPEELQQHFEQMTDPMRRERQQGTHTLGLESPAAAIAIQTVQKVINLMDECLQRGPWLAGNEYSLVDPSAVPYVYRIRALRLTALWDDKPNVAAWLDRAVARAESLDLETPWGSPSFADMVEKYSEQELPQINKLLNSLEL